MSDSLRILTLNCEETLVHQLAGSGHRWFVGLWKRSSTGPAGWNEKLRPKPDNVAELTTPREIIKGIEERKFDLAICPGLEHLSFLKDFSLPLILYFGQSLPALARARAMKPGALREEVHRWLTMKRGLFVTTSRGKYESWKIEGEIIAPGLSPGSYSGYVGDTAKALVAGDSLKDRDYLTGYSNLRKLLTHFPYQVLGYNPDLPQAHQPESWEELKKHFRTFRVYACALQAPYEDGWDMPLLEAMATGMPVTSLENPTSPVRDGVDGYISSDLRALRTRVKELLENHDLAFRLGQSARARVLELFPLARAHELWNNAFSKALEKFQNREGRSPRSFIPLKSSPGPVAEERPAEPETRTLPEILREGALPLERAVPCEASCEATPEEYEALLAEIANGSDEPQRASGELPLELSGGPRSRMETLLRFAEPPETQPEEPPPAPPPAQSGYVIPLSPEPAAEAARKEGASAHQPGLTPVQKEFLAQVPRTALTVLDVGCGAGLLGEELKRFSSREVVGLEADRSKARKASLVLDEVVTGDAESVNLEDRDGYFDCLLYFNTLEEMKDPWAALLRHSRYVKRGGVVVVSFLNARFSGVINALLQGKWALREGFPGKSILHLFTLADMEHAIQQAGYVIEESSAFPGADFPARETFEELVGSLAEGSRDLVEETRIRSYHLKARKPS